MVSLLLQLNTSKDLMLTDYDSILNRSYALPTKSKIPIVEFRM